MNFIFVVIDYEDLIHKSLVLIEIVDRLVSVPYRNFIVATKSKGKTK